MVVAICADVMGGESVLLHNPLACIGLGLIGLGMVKQACQWRQSSQPGC